MRLLVLEALELPTLLQMIGEKGCEDFDVGVILGPMGTGVASVDAKVSPQFVAPARNVVTITIGCCSGLQAGALAGVYVVPRPGSAAGLDDGPIMVCVIGIEVPTGGKSPRMVRARLRPRW